MEVLKRKLTSRKFLISLFVMITATITIITTDNSLHQIGAWITLAADVLAYNIGEGSADMQNKEEEK